MSTIRSFQVNNKLFLAKHLISQTKAPEPVEVPTDHIVVIDCSGSMAYDLPKIREQLKRKLPKLVAEKDTVSIVWFSGRGQCGTLLEGEPVATLADLAAVNKAIDRWLQPVGLTGFKEPIQEVTNLVQRLRKKRPDAAASSLIFMSDGCDNCWTKSEILKVLEEAAGGLNAATFVEYGYYADRPLLTAMAEKAGGTLIFSEGFDTYMPVLETSLSKKVTSAPKIEVELGNVDVVGGFAFALDGEDLLTFSVDGGKVRVPETVTSIGYLTSSISGTLVSALNNQTDEVLDLAYAALSLYATRMNSDVVFALLRALGDVSFIEQYSTCFGKQAYSAFQQSAKLAASKPHLRYLSGYDPNRVPREDAFTVLEMLHLLASDESNRLLLGHPSFRYSRIGRGRVDASTVLTAEEQEEVERLSEELKSTKDAKKIAELANKIASLMEGKEALRFEATEPPDGYEVNGLVWNEERPNVSVRVCKMGTVDISKRCPEEFKGKLPQLFPTFVFRNYTIIKDGLVNVDVLPVKLSTPTKEKLQKAIQEDRLKASVISTADDRTTLINLKDLPVINRQMVKSASAKLLFQLEWELIKSRAAQKVYKHFREELLGKRKSVSFVETYGQECADWLKDQGITDYGGFNPKSVMAEATDFYMGKEMSVSIKSFSSLPTIKKAREKKASGKMTPSEALLVKYIDQVEGALGQADFSNLTDAQKRMLLTWLEEETKAAIETTRDLIFKKAQLLFAVTVGQVWFSEFSSLDENTLLTDLDDHILSCKVEMREVEIKI